VKVIVWLVTVTVAGELPIPPTPPITLENQSVFPGATAVALKLDETEYVDGTQRSSSSSRSGRR
jgi:hypothetical protein